MDVTLSQRSLHNAPIFRLLLKVAVKGTHQCDLLNFWGCFRHPTTRPLGNVWGIPHNNIDQGGNTRVYSCKTFAGALCLQASVDCTCTGSLL